ncbi:MAG: hypothetical protein KAS72_14085 [Phycisphaerales bacterium]|nr:hypothetical protein [Phycisphaerales bacterium]
MTKTQDPVENAFRSLSGRHWPEHDNSTQLEDRIMNHLESSHSSTLLSRHRTLFAAAAVLVLVSVGFATAIVISRTLHVTTEINGEVIDSREVTLDESGSATFTIPTDSIESEDGTAEITMTLEAGEGCEGDGMTVAEITIEGGGGDEAEVSIQTLPIESEQSDEADE